jgi:tungstate transport system permease protein
VAYIAEGIREALRLLISGDGGVYGIVGVSLFVASVATGMAALIGLPIGYAVAVGRFRGRRAIVTLINTLLALPTVVVGLFVYALLSRRGPAGFLDLLYTPGAMIIGETVLAVPIVAAFTLSAFRSVDPRVADTALTLGATRGQMARILLLEARFGILAAIVASFGRVIAEVGIAMMLGGNIKGSTRTMTTAIALETNKGEFGLAIALGMILLATAFVANILFQWLQGFSE